MIKDNSIGGFLGLEGCNIFDEGAKWKYAVNSGRAGLELILKHYKPNLLWIPAFICSCVPDFLRKTGQRFVTYHLDGHLEIVENIELNHGEMLLYVNYFGIMDSYCSKLKKLYKRSLILDLTQSFFYQQRLCDEISFSSARKFFGVPDGGIVTGVPDDLVDSLPDTSGSEYSLHLLMRYDGRQQDAYRLFQKNEERFDHEPVGRMSFLSRNILNGINMDAVRKKRKNNFLFVQSALKKQNQLHFDEKCISPISYPFMIRNGAEIRKKMIGDNIFIPQYWPHLYDLNEYEQMFAENIVHICIDQRYNDKNIQRILDFIADFL